MLAKIIAAPKIKHYFSRLVNVANVAYKERFYEP